MNDIQRSIRSMEVSFPAWIAEFPRAVERGHVGKWAAALHAYVDLIACVEEVAIVQNETPTSGENGVSEAESAPVVDRLDEAERHANAISYRLRSW